MTKAIVEINGKTFQIDDIELFNSVDNLAEYNRRMGIKVEPSFWAKLYSYNAKMKADTEESKITDFPKQPTSNQNHISPTMHSRLKRCSCCLTVYGPGIRCRCGRCK